MGNLLAVVVHAANIHDTKAGILAAHPACDMYPRLNSPVKKSFLSQNAGGNSLILLNAILGKKYFSTD